MTKFHDEFRDTGNGRNQMQNMYNNFNQLTQSYQAHGGAVNTGTTPQVQYSYADGSSNTIRITGMTYPNGRNVVDDYGTTGSMNDAASRLGFVCLTSCGSDFSRFQASEQRERVPSYRAVRPTGSRAMPLFGMKDSEASSNLVEYSYLGLSGFVKTVYPVSGAQYTLIGTTGGTNPDSGDIYLGLDRFGRVIDANWANVAGTATLARVKYGHNRVSSRAWRDNLSPGMTGYDELYGYDQLQRLRNLGRGTLNGTQTAITSDGLKKVSGTLEATPDNSNEGSTESSRHLFQHITSPTFGQDWTLDETGNWNGFKQSDNGTTWPLDQARTANTVNGITSLVNETSKAWTTPGYDKAGNMTRIPVPGTLPDGVAWNSMTLSEWDNLKLADWEEMTLDNVEGTYDAWNRLVRLHVGDTTLAEYAYDARAILPPLPQFFAVSASFHMAASRQKIGGEGWGEGAVFACCHPRKPPHPAWRPPSPPKPGRRNCTDNIQTEARHYYYTPGWQVVEERVGTSTTADRQFVWGLRYIDDLVLRDRDTDGNGTLDERRYCLQDGNWNTIALTSTSGTVTERFNYDAYGVPTFLTSDGTVQAASATRWETLYAGYRWDGDLSRIYYVRNRFLLPYIGTWNRRDPVGYASGLGLYHYVGSSPTYFVDPSGLCDEQTEDNTFRDGNFLFLGKPEDVRKIRSLWEQINERANENSNLKRELRKFTEGEVEVALNIVNDSSGTFGGAYNTANVDITDVLTFPKGDGPFTQPAEVLLHEVAEQWMKKTKYPEVKSGTKGFGVCHAYALRVEGLFDGWERPEKQDSETEGDGLTAIEIQTWYYKNSQNLELRATTALFKRGKVQSHSQVKDKLYNDWERRESK